MNDIIIKKNATYTLWVDPRKDGDPLVDWNAYLMEAVATFSMYDVETGCYVIANQPAEIVAGGVALGDATLAQPLGCAEDATNFYLRYNFRARDTKHNGIYRATFQLNSLVGDDVLAVPARKDIQVFIIGSAIAPARTFTGMPEIITPVTTYPVYFGSSSMLPTAMINALAADTLDSDTLAHLGLSSENRTDRLVTKTINCSGGRYAYILWPVAMGTGKPLAYSPVDYRMFSAFYLNPVTIKDAQGVRRDYILLNTAIQNSSAFYLRLIS
jgi:hypothetical protein